MCVLYILTAGVRGRHVLTPSASTISALDHDQNCKGHLTPSVILQSELPDDPSKSFCTGQVTVSVNDSVFQASTPFRHAASIRSIVSTQPICFIFSDGGPDHRLTYESVKMSLVALFKATNLDMLVACRCAPGQSWMNPVERIMALLNLALQNTALERSPCTPEIEGMCWYILLRFYVVTQKIERLQRCVQVKLQNAQMKSKSVDVLRSLSLKFWILHVHL